MTQIQWNGRSFFSQGEGRRAVSFATLFQARGTPSDCECPGRCEEVECIVSRMFNRASPDGPKVSAASCAWARLHLDRNFILASSSCDKPTSVASIVPLRSACRASHAQERRPDVKHGEVQRGCSIDGWYSK